MDVPLIRGLSSSESDMIGMKGQGLRTGYVDGDRVQVFRFRKRDVLNACSFDG